MGGEGTDGSGEAAILALLEATHLLAPHLLVPEVAKHAIGLGLQVRGVYLVDLRQSQLTPLPHSAPECVPQTVDSTVAGLAYRTVSIRTVEADGGHLRVWIPVVDGVDRLGVLEVLVAEWTAPVQQRLRAVAALLALLILSKQEYSDTYARLRRTEPMTLPAEMEWAFMPPLSLATPKVVLNGVLEPVYRLGGDAFDYSLIEEVLHVSVFDSMGHDIQAGIAASVAMGACRNSRRAGLDLAEMVTVIDEAIDEQFDRIQFVTGFLSHLDLDTGRLRWVNCGQPPPLVIRDGRVVRVLRSAPRPPLGLGPMLGTGPATVHEERLQPGDRIMYYTDGVVDALSPDGQATNLDQLADLVQRDSGRDLPPAERLRRLIRALVEHSQGSLSDDATIVMVDWAAARTGALHP